MGMSASDYKKVSKSGLITENKLIYLAGNAISINVLESIFKKLEF
jgi:DNA (cytosine-5)-methyltransferase 1